MTDVQTLEQVDIVKGLCFKIFAKNCRFEQFATLGNDPFL